MAISLYVQSTVFLVGGSTKNQGNILVLDKSTFGIPKMPICCDKRWTFQNVSLLNVSIPVFPEVQSVDHSWSVIPSNWVCKTKNFQKGLKEQKKGLKELKKG